MDGRVAQSQARQTALLCVFGATLSAFMNNVGALAIVMPIALTLARRFDYSPAQVLMPLSFATLLGGTMTLIGTPPNLLVAGMRTRYAEAPFGFFDFAPVGIVITLAGIAFMILGARYLLPSDRRGQRSGLELFDVGHYVTEIRLAEDSPLAAKTVGEIEAEHADRLVAVALLRGGLRQRGRLSGSVLAEGDVLIVQADAELLQELARGGAVDIVTAHSKSGDKEELVPPGGGVETIEVVVPPNSWLQGQTARGLALRRRWNVNLLAISRKGRPIAERVRDTRIFAGDILLLEGDPDVLAEATRELGCLPLANRRIALHPFQLLLPLAIFAAAIAAIVLEITTPPVAFVAGAVGVVALRVVPVREIYDAIDWPIIVLLGAMIPVGGVLETTGLAQLLAEQLAVLGTRLPDWGVLALVMVATMAVTPILNNATTVIVMVPIVIGVAQQLGMNPDAFVMAVAIGASCDFLTPFGHQNNTLIMAAGGYRFADFWRLGLPMDMLVLVLGVATLLLVFPLRPT
jgi:di/tricarboxylate transporter